MIRWLVVATALFGCHKDKTSAHTPSPSPGPTAPVSTAELDALWAKAPAGATVGIVMSPRAVTMTEHAWQDVHAFLKQVPQFAPAEQKLQAGLAKYKLGPDFSLEAIGFGPAKGAALFFADGGDSMFAILPVVDRDKLVAKAEGKRSGDVDMFGHVACKPIDGGYYACADSADQLARFGKGNLRGGLDAAKARGDLEMVVSSPVAVAAVAQLGRGAVVVRGAVAGIPALYTSKLGPPHALKVDLGHDSGFAMLDLRALLDGVPELPIVEGVTTTALVKSIAGPMMVNVSSGDFTVDTRLPLNDVAPAKRLIQHCGDLPPQLGAKLDGDKCHIPVPQFNVDAVGSIDGNDLHFIAKTGSSAAADVPPTAAGAQLAKEPWSAAFWGRGTILAPVPNSGALPWAQLPDEAGVVIRVLVMMSEVGVGLRVDGDRLEFMWTMRTGWSNPDDVVARLEAVDPAQVIAGKSAALGKAIADASPGSPFAADYKSGYGGMMVPTAIVGMMAAVAVPAFLEYMKKSKASESSVQLNRIGKALKRHYGEFASFPAGDAQVLPPFPTCCGLSSTGQGIDNKCPNDPTAWRKDKIWSSLEFEIDEPTSYRYGYHSDGKTVTVTATGDTDCDGNFATFELRGELVDGMPQMTLVKPPAGAF